MIENVRLSFQGIWSHKMRSFLAMLGIIIGIASIISIVSTIQGTNEQIKQNLVGSGNNVVRIQLYQDDFIYETAWNGIPPGFTPVSEATHKDLQDIPGAEKAVIYNRRSDYNNAVYYNDTSLSGCEIYGVTSDYFSAVGYAVKRGRNFVPKDFDNFRQVMIIDDAVAQSLFYGDDPIGQTVEYQSTAYVIIGIVEEMRQFEPAINSIDDYYTYNQSGMTSKIFIPKSNWPVPFAYDEPEEVAIRCQSTDDMSFVGNRAADILNETKQNETVAYKAENLLQKAKELQDLSNATNQQLIWIASISLLVGGIGVMNIMLVTVTERTREIGLKKAIGAKKGRIRTQFLTEAAVLTSIGGVLGVGAGIALAQFISQVTETPFSINVASIFLSVAFSIAIGVLFGILPAIKAANLNPIDALRHE